MSTFILKDKELFGASEPFYRVLGGVSPRGHKAAAVAAAAAAAAAAQCRTCGLKREENGGMGMRSMKKLPTMRYGGGRSKVGSICRMVVIGVFALILVQQLLFLRTDVRPSRPVGKTRRGSGDEDRHKGLLTAELKRGISEHLLVVEEHTKGQESLGSGRYSGPGRGGNLLTSNGAQGVLGTGELVSKLRELTGQARVYLAVAEGIGDEDMMKNIRGEIKESDWLMERTENGLLRMIVDHGEDGNVGPLEFRSRIESMERLIERAKQLPYNSELLISQLKSKLENAERATRDVNLQSKLYSQMAAKAVPKGLHCLAMRLTQEYASGSAFRETGLPGSAVDLEGELDSLGGRDLQESSGQAVTGQQLVVDRSGGEVGSVVDRSGGEVGSLGRKGLDNKPGSLRRGGVRVGEEDPRYLDNRLHHYAVFSDNVLAVGVVINSTAQNLGDVSQHVFHVVTDRINYAAMKAWFALNPPGAMAIEVRSLDEYPWVTARNVPVLRQIEGDAMRSYYFRPVIQQGPSLLPGEDVAEFAKNFKYRNPKYLSILNHLRFYLPRIFPHLDKVLFLDDDVVVQKDLSPLWEIPMDGNVNLAVETCGETFHRFHTYLNFSHPLIADNFDPEGCAWAFGMNMFDLAAWRMGNYTDVYHYWQQENEHRTLWKLGTLPPGLLTFYKATKAVPRSWHVLGLGSSPSINLDSIRNAAVIHYNGHAKPWLELALVQYQSFWAKYVPWDHEMLQQCNLTPPE